MFEFDYFGDNQNLDFGILSAEIWLYEKGLQILTGLNRDSLFIQWHSPAWAKSQTMSGRRMTSY
jgi:hypothetical protein